MPKSAHIPISEFRERLTLRTASNQDQGGGSVVTTWSDGATIAGRVRPLQGNEYLTGRQVVGAAPYEVMIRRPLPTGSALAVDGQIVWQAPGGNKTLFVKSPLTLTPDHRYYRFMAAEKD